MGKIRNGIRQIKYKFYAFARYFLFNGRGSPHSLPGHLIVSLTSYPPRFNTLHLTVKTLLSQDVKPDLTILVLYKEDKLRLPRSVFELVGDRFKIMTTDDDIKSFKKIVPVKKKYKSSFIVTADDDVYYESSWLKELCNGYENNKKHVIGHRAHKVTSNLENEINKYERWNFNISDNTPGKNVFLTGVGGVLYPPESLSEESMKDSIFTKLCPTADDVWLYFMIRKNGFKCKKVGRPFREISWGGTQEIGLFKKNISKSLNDDAVSRMIERYGNPLSDDYECLK